MPQPPSVIPIDLGRQLLVGDFLIESSTLTRSLITSRTGTSRHLSSKRKHLGNTTATATCPSPRQSSMALSMIPRTCSARTALPRWIRTDQRGHSPIAPSASSFTWRAATFTRSGSARTPPALATPTAAKPWRDTLRSPAALLPSRKHTNLSLQDAMKGSWRSAPRPGGRAIALISERCFQNLLPEIFQHSANEMGQRGAAAPGSGYAALCSKSYHRFSYELTRIPRSLPIQHPCDYLASN